MYPIIAGWRWLGSGLWYTKECEREDELLSPIERTKRVVFGRMNGLTECLAFTVETEEESGDGWLPTLGFKLRVNAQNIIDYAFYEKPTT